MAVKKGRPTIDNAKDYMLRVRMNEDSLRKLDECCDTEKKSRSEVVRECIDEKHSKLKK